MVRVIGWFAGPWIKGETAGNNDAISRMDRK